ncbi:MAG: flavodoxin domain-containing protein [Jatrophihabitantaceae bacterium]
MRAVVVYESMYGNTRQVAQAIAAGLAERLVALALPVSQAGPLALAGAELIVVGGPTHAWSMSRPATRTSAAEQAPAKGLVMDESASGIGVREWLATRPGEPRWVAAFDTRLNAPAALTGRASRSISQQLRRYQLPILDRPQSFLVSKANKLADGELDRARDWGRLLAQRLAPVPA